MSIDVFPATVLNATLWNGQTYEEGSFTVTATGFSGTAPSGTVQYVRMGKQVTLRFPQILGTSNATTFTLTGMPPSLWPTGTGSAYVMVRAQDNVGTLPASLLVSSGGTITLQPMNTLVWTASGSKALEVCAVTYLL